MRRFVLGIAAAVTSLMPTIGMADDPQIADYIKGRLQSEQQQGNLRGFNVDMRVEQGTVWFTRFSDSTALLYATMTFARPTASNICAPV